VSEAAEAAEDLKKLGDAAEQAGKKLKDAEKVAGLTGDKLAKLKELAIGAVGGEEAVEKWKKGTEALKLAGDKTATTGQRFVAGAAAAKNFASSTMAIGSAAANVVTSIIELIQNTDKASAAIYQYDQRATALSGSMASIRAATAGAVDEQTAYALTFALSERGMVANREQLATLLRASREYAQTRQVTQEQASAVLRQALDGDANAAAQFGISLNGATTAADRQRQVLSQLAQQHRGVAAAQQDATERAQLRERAENIAQSRAMAAVGRAAQAITSTGAVYRWAIDRTQAQIERTDGLTKSTEQYDLMIRRTAATVQQLQATERARLDDASRATALAQNAANVDLTMLGERVTGMTSVISAQDQYNQALREANTLQRRAGEEQPAFEQRKLQVTNNLIEAVRRKNTEQTRRDTLEHQRVELGLLANQIRAHGGSFDARVRSLTPAQRLLEIQREIAGFSRRENETLEQANARLLGLGQELQQRRDQANEAANRAADTRTAQREANALQSEAQDLGLKLATVERRAGEQRLEYLQRLVQAQREMNGLVLENTEYTEENQRTLQQITDRVRKREQDDQEAADETRRRQVARDEAEVTRLHALADKRREELDRANAEDPLLQARAAFGLAEEEARTATQSMAQGAKVAYDAFGELGAGIAEAIKSATESGDDVGAAVAKQVDDWAAAKALQWGLQAAESLAGAGVAYFIRPDAVPGLLASAGMYAGLAAAAGITTAAIPNAPAASASGTAGGDRERGLGMASSMRSDSAATVKAQAPVVFNVSGFTSTESAQEGIVRALAEAQARGLISRSWQ
jgi:hypothetical protein